MDDECCGEDQPTNKGSGVASNQVKQEQQLPSEVLDNASNPKQMSTELSYKVSSRKTQTREKVRNHKPGDLWEEDCCGEE